MKNIGKRISIFIVSFIILLPIYTILSSTVYTYSFNKICPEKEKTISTGSFDIGGGVGYNNESRECINGTILTSSQLNGELKWTVIQFSIFGSVALVLTVLTSYGITRILLKPRTPPPTS